MESFLLANRYGLTAGYSKLLRIAHTLLEIRNQKIYL